tara:strand:- start:39 stop:440 length:402 start_codon:yes stop_codon:yes gene_type:complete
MEAKELRIGNYVNNEQRTEVIDAIDPYRVQCHLLSDKTRETLYEVPLQFIKPILLTEDWLLKFGFEKNEDDYNFKGFCLEDRNADPFLPEQRKLQLKDSFGVWRNNHFLTNIKHLHQLQNLYFALTNDELIIK